MSAKTLRQFGINVWSNGVLLALKMGVGLWFTPYLIKHLGVGVYGLIPLANSVAAYMSVLEISVRGALGKELSASVALRDDVEMSRVYNTALWASIMLALVLLPLAVGVSFLAPAIFDVPLGSEDSARLLFGTVLVMYLVGMVRSIMTTVPFSSNCFEYLSVTSVSEIVIRLSTVVLLFSLVSARLDWVSASLVVSGVMATAIAAGINRRLLPRLRLSFRAFSRQLLRRMWGLSSWMMVNQMGSLLFLSVDVIIVNLVLGSEASGRYGALLVWSTFLRSLAAAVSNAVTPVVLQRQALKRDADISRIATDAIKLLGAAMAVLVGLLVGFAPQVLRVWLGPEYEGLAVILIVQVMHLAVNLAVIPLFSVQLARGKVRTPGLVTLGSGVLNAGLAWFMAPLGSWGLGVALAGAIVLTAKNVGFTAIYTATIQNLNRFTYVRALWVPLASLVITAGLSLLSVFVTEPSNWGVLILQGLLLGSTASAIVYFLILNSTQRRIVRAVLPLGGSSQ